MTTGSVGVFRDMAFLHPGSKRLVNSWHHVCPCTSPSCVMEAAQHIAECVDFNHRVFVRWLDFIAGMDNGISCPMDWNIAVIWAREEFRKSKLH